MKSVHFPIKQGFGYKLARKETNSVLWAKYLADQLIRETFELSAVQWVTERETYTRDVGHKTYPNGDFTGEFTREVVVLGSVKCRDDIKRVEVEVKIMMSGVGAGHTLEAPCWIELNSTDTVQGMPYPFHKVTYVAKGGDSVRPD